MSHHRLWSLQILIISIPVLIFSFIAAQSNAKFQKYKETIEQYEKTGGIVDDSSTSTPLNAVDNDYHKRTQHYNKAKSKVTKYKEKSHMNYEEGKSEDIVWTATIRRTYLITCVIKLFMEIMYIWHLYLLQTKQTNQTGFFNSAVWQIPEKYLCSVGEERHHACSQDTEVPCFVSRSWEKRIFLYYYMTMSISSIALVILDIIYVSVKVSIKKVRRSRERRHLQHQAYYRGSHNGSVAKLHRKVVDDQMSDGRRSAASIHSFRSQKQTKQKMFTSSSPQGSRVELIKDT